MKIFSSFFGECLESSIADGKGARTNVYTFRNNKIEHTYSEDNKSFESFIYIDGQLTFSNVQKNYYSSKNIGSCPNAMIFMTPFEVERMMNKIEHMESATFSSLDEAFFIYTYPDGEGTPANEYIIRGKRNKMFIDDYGFFTKEKTLFSLSKMTSLLEIAIYESLSDNDFFYYIVDGHNQYFLDYNEKDQLIELSLYNQFNKENNGILDTFPVMNNNHKEIIDNWLFDMCLKTLKPSSVKLFDEYDLDLNDKESFFKVFDMIAI